MAQVAIEALGRELAGVAVATVHLDAEVCDTEPSFGRKQLRLRRLEHTLLSRRERGRRPGTENVAGAVSFASALELAIGAESVPLFVPPVMIKFPVMALPGPVLLERPTLTPLAYAVPT